MNSDKQRIQAVPTNVITGFLGVGKTSAILHLLKNKPRNERWAILVNEFGEIGVDGSLFEGKYTTEQNIFVREVPGGCMCCSSGLPMQIALTQLLSEARPDRLLIEPTGLGHPQEVLEVLTSSHYSEALSLQKTLTLVDARKLADSRYTNHETFNQQIAVADIVIGNKLDLYQAEDQEKLISYVKQKGKTGAEVLFTQQGKLSLTTLKGELKDLTLPLADEHENHHDHDHQSKPLAADFEIPECGYIKAINKGEGFYSIGWRFASDKVFDYHKLYALLIGLECERMKSVFITNQGIFGYNQTPDAMTEMPLDGSPESRVEIIAEQNDDELQAQLLSCIIGV